MKASKTLYTALICLVVITLMLAGSQTALAGDSSSDPVYDSDSNTTQQGVEGESIRWYRNIAEWDVIVSFILFRNIPGEIDVDLSL